MSGGVGGPLQAARKITKLRKFLRWHICGGKNAAILKFSKFVQNIVEKVCGEFGGHRTIIRRVINARSELRGPLWTFVGGQNEIFSI